MSISCVTGSTPRSPPPCACSADGAVFRVYDTLYDVYYVYLVLRRLQRVLRSLELHRARHDTVEFLDAGRELLGVGKLFLYVFLYALLDLLGTDAVRVDGVGDVVHDGLELHKVSRLQKLDDLSRFSISLRKECPRCRDWSPCVMTSYQVSCDPHGECTLAFQLNVKGQTAHP